MGHLPYVRTLVAATCTSIMWIPSGLTAQEAAPDSPPVIQIGIETVRAGRGAQHTELEERWAATFREAKVPVYWLGTTAVTGANEFWWFTPLSSVAELEAQDKAVAGAPGLSSASDLLSKADGENVESNRTLLARYRGELSRPGGVPVPTARYFQVLMFRVRPGHNADFETAAKLYNTVVTEASGSGHWVTYEIISGMPGPTFLVFTAMKSLSEMDPGPDMEALAKAMTPARQKQFNDLSAAGIISTTSLVFQFQPRMSNLPPEVTAMDPTFWNVHP